MSVIVTYFNASVYLEALRDSLMGQRAAEVIVVVDGGHEHELVATMLAPVPRLKVITTPKALGSAGARNAGADLATQPWITFLDDDDQWPDGFLAELFSQAHENVLAYDNHLLQQMPSGEIVSLGMTVFERQNFVAKPLAAHSAGQLISGYPILKLLLRRDVFLRLGGYRLELFAVQDFDLVWRLVAAGNVIQLVERPLGRYLVRPGGVTGRIASGEFMISVNAQLAWMNIWFRMSRARTFAPEVRLAAARNGVRSARTFASLIVRKALGNPKGQTERRNRHGKK